MSTKKLNEQQVEQLVIEVMPKVGRRQDEAIYNSMKNMSPEELDQLLAEMKAEDEAAETGETKGKKVPFPFWRLAAACAALVVILAGVHYMDLGQAPGNNYARIYKNDYKAFDESTFNARGNTKNAYGKTNTAGIIEEASKLICEKHSRRALHKGIDELQELLTRKNFDPALEDEIYWYLGLAYLKDNRVAKAREEFWKVVYLKSPNHAERAKEMLERLM